MSGASKDDNHAVMSDPVLRRDAESFLKGVLLGNSARVLKNAEGMDAEAAAKPENAKTGESSAGGNSGKQGQPASVSESLSLDGLSELASRIERATGKRIRSYREIQED